MMEKEELCKAIWKRRSQRDYLPKPIEKEKIATLNGMISEINRVSGLSIEFVEDGRDAFKSKLKTFGMIKGARSAIVLKGKEGLPDLREKCGYYGEDIVLSATNMGLGTCWIAKTYDQKSPALLPKEGEERVCIITIGYVAEEIADVAEPDAPHRKTRSIEAMSVVEGGVAPYWFTSAMKAVQFAPTARNSQKATFRYKDGAVSASVPDTYEWDLIDLGIVKLHFELSAGGKFEFGNPGKFTKE